MSQAFLQLLVIVFGYVFRKDTQAWFKSIINYLICLFLFSLRYRGLHW